MTPGQEAPHLGGDTSRESLRVQFEALRSIPPARRLALMDELTQLVRAMSREGLRRRHSGLTETELDDRFSELVLGPELAARVREHRLSRKPPPMP